MNDILKQMLSVAKDRPQKFYNPVAQQSMDQRDLMWIDDDDEQDKKQVK